MIPYPISAIETQPEDAEEITLSDLLSGDFSKDCITICPLFEGVVLGGAPGSEHSTGDLLADILNALKKLPEK